jgi:hypothetical protein
MICANAVGTVSNKKVVELNKKLCYEIEGHKKLVFWYWASKIKPSEIII